MENCFAHIDSKKNRFQSVWDHLSETSAFAGQFADKVGLREVGETLGLLHDLGKASQEFQNYICSAEGLIDPDQDAYVDVIAKKGKIDHSSAGAQIIYDVLSSRGAEGVIAAQVLALCIASHHSGLADCLSPDGENKFKKRIEKPDESTHSREAWSHLSEEEQRIVNQHLKSETLSRRLVEKFKSLKENSDHQDTYVFKWGLLIRFLFSCLIDADRLNTADFESPGNARFRQYGRYHPWQTLIERLDVKVRAFESKPEKNEVDDLRNRVSQSCFDFSTRPKGIYQLSVPTGGGKTLASLRFALNHAAHHQMDRIFYVIPYTSIIDQNADEVRKILEDKDATGRYLDNVVLEHHSNLTPEEETRRQNLLAENWDAPVVFTTQVQFLETLFGAGTRGARRMHQLANSVIIFDEIQTLPVCCVHMFNLAVRFLVQGCGATVVLSTATQPLLDQISPIHRSLSIGPEQKMIPNEDELAEKLRRVEVFDRRKVGGWSDEEIAELVAQELNEKGSVLIIVNTKKSARSLYQTLAEKNFAMLYHLSTNMCPAHRLAVLNAVREKLKNKQPVICVSTQLIEAGVDVDFGAVIRYLAGLDSIVQAAGRCNRNGQQESPGHVWVVNPVHENIDRLKDIVAGIKVTERLLDEFNDNPGVFQNDRIGRLTTSKYYKYYFYRRSEEMMYPIGKDSPAGREDDLFNLLSLNTKSVGEYVRVAQTAPDIRFRQSFQTASRAFHVIDALSRGVIVPYEKEGEELIHDLCGAFEVEKQYGLLKKAQRYSVNLFFDEFKRMVDAKAIREVQEGSGIFYLDSSYYSDQFGWCDKIVNEMKPLIY